MPTKKYISSESSFFYPRKKSIFIPNKKIKQDYINQLIKRIKYDFFFNNILLPHVFYNDISHVYFHMHLKESSDGVNGVRKKRSG